MSTLTESLLFWAGVIGFVVVTMTVINFIFRAVANRRASEQEHYPHRVANELPRTLHKTDHDEVLDLKSEPVMKE